MAQSDIMDYSKEINRQTEARMFRFIGILVILVITALIFSALVWFGGHVIGGLTINFLAWWKWTFIVLSIIELCWQAIPLISLPVGLLGWNLGKQIHGYSRPPYDTNRILEENNYLTEIKSDDDGPVT